ncbi:MAG TPA: hypothetical protein VKQ72_05835 [Aggregatilineales bacterium]|nr:hypothetical protein [Aggregatilineales bacterium]
MQNVSPAGPSRSGDWHSIRWRVPSSHNPLIPRSYKVIAVHLQSVNRCAAS